MTFATVYEEPKPEYFCSFMGLHCWTDPKVEPGTVELRDQYGKVLGTIANVKPGSVIAVHQR